MPPEPGMIESPVVIITIASRVPMTAQTRTTMRFVNPPYLRRDPAALLHTPIEITADIADNTMRPYVVSR